MSSKRIRSGFGTSQAQNVQTTPSALQHGWRDGGITRYDGMGNVYIDEGGGIKVVTATQQGATRIKSLVSTKKLNSGGVLTKSTQTFPNDDYSHILGKAPRRWWYTYKSRHIVIAHDTEGLMWVDGSEYVTRGPVVASTVHNNRVIVAMVIDQSVYIDSYKLSSALIPFRGRKAGIADLYEVGGGDKYADRVTEFINHGSIAAAGLGLVFSENHEIWGYSSGAFNWSGTQLVITKLSSNLIDSLKITLTGTEIDKNGNGGTWGVGAVIADYNPPVDAPIFNFPVSSVPLVEEFTPSETWYSTHYGTDPNGFFFDSWRAFPEFHVVLEDGIGGINPGARIIKDSAAADGHAFTDAGESVDVIQYNCYVKYIYFQDAEEIETSVRVGESYVHKKPVVFETFMDKDTGDINHLTLNQTSPTELSAVSGDIHVSSPYNPVDYNIFNNETEVTDDFSINNPELVDGIDVTGKLQSTSPGKFLYTVTNLSGLALFNVSSVATYPTVPIGLCGQKGIVIFSNNEGNSETWKGGAIIHTKDWDGQATSRPTARVTPTSDNLDAVCVQIRMQNAPYAASLITTDGTLSDQIDAGIVSPTHPIFIKDE